MLVTVVLKARADLLLSGRVAGRLTTISDGADRAFADRDELVELLLASARQVVSDAAGDVASPPCC